MLPPRKQHSRAANLQRKRAGVKQGGGINPSQARGASWWGSASLCDVEGTDTTPDHLCSASFHLPLISFYDVGQQCPSEKVWLSSEQHICNIFMNNHLSERPRRRQAPGCPDPQNNNLFWSRGRQGRLRVLQGQSQREQML